MAGVLVATVATAVLGIGVLAAFTYHYRWQFTAPLDPIPPLPEPLAIRYDHSDDWLPEATSTAWLEPNLAAHGKRLAADIAERAARECREYDWTTYDRLKHAAHLARSESQQLEETR